MGSINSKVMKLKRNSGLFIMKSDPSMKYGDDDMDDPAIMRHPKTKALIKRSLLRNGIFTQEVDFHNITASDMEKIIDCFNIRNFECGVKLFERNDSPTDHLYIVRKGIFKCTSDQETLAIYREGDLMGEVGFFHDVGRCLTITADTADASSFCISKREFQLIVEKGRDLNNIKILNSLTEAQKYLLKDGMSVSNYLRGNTSTILTYLPILLTIHRLILFPYFTFSHLYCLLSRMKKLFFIIIILNVFLIYR